jgi:hypothetical protein
MSTTIDPTPTAMLVLHYQDVLARPESIFAFSGTAAQVEKHDTLARAASAIENTLPFFATISSTTEYIAALGGASGASG